jgi:large subunit ribosomal protein L9
MKIILRENIENLGRKGDIVNVAAGYGRNYLLPKKMALELTPTNMKMIEMEQKALRKGLEKEMKSVQALIERLNQVTLSFKRKTGEKDTLFGSVSVADIKDGLDHLGFEIEKRRILLTEPIKALGTFTVPIKAFHEERAEIRIEVIADAPPVETPKIPEPEKAEAPQEEGPVAEEKPDLVEESGDGPAVSETEIEDDSTLIE